MSNSPDEDEKERLTSEEFVDLIPHLPCSNLLEIEFFLDGWSHLISLADSSRRGDISRQLFRCNLCKIILSGFKSVTSHINGRKHLGNMCDVKYFYHPEYTFTKKQLRKAFQSKRKNNDQNETSEKNTTLSTQPDISQEKSESKVVNTSSNVESKSTTAEESNKVNQTQNTSLAKPVEELPVANEVSDQKDLKNKNPVECRDLEKQTQENVNKNVNENKEPQKINTQLQQKPETSCKNDAKASQSPNKSPNQNKMKDSIPQMKQTPTQKPIENKATDNTAIKTENSESTKSKPCLRLVPLVKLQKKPEENPNQILNVSIDKDVKSNKSGNEKNIVNTGLVKSDSLANQAQRSNQSAGSEGLSTTNQKLKAVEPTKSIEIDQKKKNDSTTSKNMESRKPEDQVNESFLPSNQKKIPVDNTSKSLNNNEKSDASAKFVKNPLAAKKNNSTIVPEKSQKEELKDATISEVIVIDDNDDDTESKNNANQVITKDSDPPSKKQKVSESSSLVTVPPQNPNKGVIAARSNLVVVPTQTTSSSTKNKDKSENEPTFAVKSVTDAMTNDKICGFVGVEYVIKICRKTAPPKYECGLCELVLDGQSMQNHLLGYNHRLKFCEKHFPTAIQQFRQYILNVPSDEHYKIMIPVLQKLTAAIEEHHGRSLPFECEERRYTLERHRVLTEVFARRHASEQRGPTFTHVVDSKQVDEFILRRDVTKDQPNSNKITFDRRETEESVNRKPNQENQRRTYEAPKRPIHNITPYQTGMQSNAFNPFTSENTFVDDETHKRMVENFLKANDKSGLFQYKSSRSNRNEREQRQSQSSKRSHSPSRIDFGSNKDSNATRNIWSSYCRLVDNKLKALRESFQKYRANPESHPSYKTEWLKFWHRRKTELMALGKDYRTYDFQPDWVPYFNNRINELFDEAFEKLKVEARDELALPMINDYLVDPKYFVHVQSDNYSPAIKKIAPSVSTIEMNRNETAMSSQMNIGAPFSLNVNKERTEAQLMRQPSESIGKAKESDTNEIEIRDESSPTVVSVLRLLTALEEFLGSLGPKILELLSKALQAEKSNQGRAQVLLTEENCTLLETAMEKFKGLVIAGILDSPKERALKKAISKVNALLEFTREIKEKHSSLKEAEFVNKTPELHQTNTDSRIHNQKPVQNINDKLKQALQSVSNTDDISKVIHLIEEKIAAALKAQGRTDVDRAHLEQLAAVCVLLEKKKREAGSLEKDSTTQTSTSQQPLSDTLKKIVGTISGNSANQGNNKNQQAQPSAANLNNKRMFPDVSGAKPIETISSHRMQGFNPSSNIGELNNFVNTGNPQGNFSNSYSKNNNQIWMGGDSNFGANSEPRSWQPPQQQQQQNVPSVGWSSYSNRSWRANEGPSTSGLNSQRVGYQNNFGVRPPGQGQYRYN